MILILVYQIAVVFTIVSGTEQILADFNTPGGAGKPARVSCYYSNWAGM